MSFIIHKVLLVVYILVLSLSHRGHMKTGPVNYSEICCMRLLYRATARVAPTVHGGPLDWEMEGRPSRSPASWIIHRPWNRDWTPCFFHVTYFVKNILST